MKYQILHHPEPLQMDLGHHEHKIFYLRLVLLNSKNRKCQYNISKHSMIRIFSSIHHKTHILM